MSYYPYYDRNKEIQEAIYAGERALSSLKKARDKLNSARNWGVLDILGGNLVTGLMKHAKVSDADIYVEQAKRDMQRFQNELRDIQDLNSMNIQINEFLVFADFFWDGVIADVVVQSRINEARRKIEDPHAVALVDRGDRGPGVRGPARPGSLGGLRGVFDPDGQARLRTDPDAGRFGLSFCEGRSRRLLRQLYDGVRLAHPGRDPDAVSARGHARRRARAGQGETGAAPLPPVPLFAGEALRADLRSRAGHGVRL